MVVGVFAKLALPFILALSLRYRSIFLLQPFFVFFLHEWWIIEFQDFLTSLFSNKIMIVFCQPALGLRKLRAIACLLGDIDIIFVLCDGFPNDLYLCFKLFDTILPVRYTSTS